MDETSGSPFSHVGLMACVPARHPPHKIRQAANAAFASLDAGLQARHPDSGSPSIASERPIRARLLRIPPVRFERQSREQMPYDLLFEWSVGMA